MGNQVVRAALLTIFAASAVSLMPRTPQSSAQATAAGAELRIAGAVSTPLTLTVADLKKMPRKTLSVVNPHTKKAEGFEGVLLEELLRRAGVPQGDKLRGPALAT
jgi:DMSO/TMAO reductase YedYZ molybdopterin-dependent catalytic subunit